MNNFKDLLAAEINLIRRTVDALLIGYERNYGDGVKVILATDPETGDQELRVQVDVVLCNEDVRKEGGAVGKYRCENVLKRICPYLGENITINMFDRNGKRVYETLYEKLERGEEEELPF